MKFNPDDIAAQTFETRFRGFDIDQVREFLGTLAREVASLDEELREIRRDRDELAAEVKGYRRREKSLQDAWEAATTAAEEMRHQAERDAQLRRAEAELDAERIMDEARRAMESAAAEVERLRDHRQRFRAELRATLEMHLHLLDSQRPPRGLEPDSTDEVPRAL